MDRRRQLGPRDGACSFEPVSTGLEAWSPHSTAWQGRTEERWIALHKDHVTVGSSSHHEVGQEYGLILRRGSPGEGTGSGFHQATQGTSPDSKQVSN